RQQHAEPENPGSVEPVGCFCPLEERRRVYSYVAVLAQHGEVFAEIQAAFQVGNTDLPLPDYRDRRGRFQPLRQPFLSHAGSYRAQKLEQAASAEQVQIRGVDVVRVVKSQSLLTGAGPEVFYSG